MKRITLAVGLLLAACNRGETVEPPNPAEAERLNEAEEMLNDLAKEEGAMPESTAPINSN